MKAITLNSILKSRSGTATCDNIIQSLTELYDFECLEEDRRGGYGRIMGKVYGRYTVECWQAKGDRVGFSIETKDCEYTAWVAKSPDLPKMVDQVLEYQSTCDQFPSVEDVAHQLKHLGYCDRVDLDMVYFDGYTAKVDRKLVLKGKKVYAEYSLSASSQLNNGFNNRGCYHSVTTSSNNLKHVIKVLDFGAYEQKVKDHHVKQLSEIEYTNRKEKLTANAREITQSLAAKVYSMNTAYVAADYVNFSISIPSGKLDAFKRAIENL